MEDVSRGICRWAKGGEPDGIRVGGPMRNVLVLAISMTLMAGATAMGSPAATRPAATRPATTRPSALPATATPKRVLNDLVAATVAGDAAGVRAAIFPGGEDEQ